MFFQSVSQSFTNIFWVLFLPVSLSSTKCERSRPRYTVFISGIVEDRAVVTTTTTNTPAAFSIIAAAAPWVEAVAQIPYACALAVMVSPTSCELPPPLCIAWQPSPPSPVSLLLQQKTDDSAIINSPACVSSVKGSRRKRQCICQSAA